MPRTPPRPRSQTGRPAALKLRVKVWFETESGVGFGRGLVEILRAVDQSGSIKQAADDLGRSYRHVWQRIKAAERAVGRTLVETHVGGTGTQRSRLTVEARRLIAEFDTLRQRLVRLMERENARRRPGRAESRG